jgi:hypothetical protein
MGTAPRCVVPDEGLLFPGSTGADMTTIDHSDSARSVQLFSERPEADAAEQRRPVVDDSPATMRRLRTPFDVDPADALDQ